MMQKPTPERIHELNQGLAQAKNLMETLSVDFHILLGAVFPEFNMPDFLPKTGITKKMQYTAQALYNQYGASLFNRCASHTSDTIRGLACYLLAYCSYPFEQKIELIKPLADDDNSGVREWAWIALRPEVIDNLEQAIAILQPWVTHSSEKMRRFASEITRPRGVWCSHIKALRQEPWRGLVLLEPLKDDPARYVQLSVGNWLNDAGKDHPEWVIQLCKEWQSGSSSPYTRKICTRALRNLKDHIAAPANTNM